MISGNAISRWINSVASCNHICCGGGSSCIVAIYIQRLIQASKHRGDAMHELMHELKFNGKFEHGSNSCEMCQNNPFYFGIQWIAWCDYSRNLSFIWNFYLKTKTWNLLGFSISWCRIYLTGHIISMVLPMYFLNAIQLHLFGGLQKLSWSKCCKYHKTYFSVVPPDYFVIFLLWFGP